METITKNIPALALRGLTAFPRMTASFDVEREISVRALERAMETGQNPFDSSQTATAASTTLYHPTAPATTAATAAPTKAAEGPIVIGGFPLTTLLIMGGIVVVFILLSVILSRRGKRGDRQ